MRRQELRCALTVRKVSACNMKLKPDAKPIIFCAPLALKAPVKKELSELYAQGIIEPVKPGGVINVSPVVLPSKEDISVQLCTDDKIHVNHKINTEAYTMPDTE